MQRYLVPPKDTHAWQRIAFQPMLYLALWIATIILMIKGDFASTPPAYVDDIGHHDSLFWVWGGLSLACPPMALASLWMINSSRGHLEYRGLWLRIGADIGQSSALTTYIVLRLSEGDYHVYPMAAVVASGVFVWHLVMRDAKRLIEVEKLANQLHRRHYGVRDSYGEVE